MEDLEISNRLISRRNKDYKIKFKDTNLPAIYGLDLEDMSYGDPMADIGDIRFFLLTNSPSFTEAKKIMFKRFLDT